MRQTIEKKRSNATNGRYYDAYRNFGKAGSNDLNRPEAKYIPLSNGPQITTEPEIKTERKRTKFLQYLIYIDPKKRNPIGAFIIMAIIFSGLLGMIAMQAFVTNAEMKNKRLRARLNDVQTFNFTINAELYENFDKDEIERIAINDLNMTKRKPYQEIRVTVPSSSYIVMGKPKETQKRKGLIESALGFFYRK